MRRLRRLGLLGLVPLAAAALTAAPAEAITGDSASASTTSTAWTTTTVRKVTPVQSWKAWIDFSGDGRADYCRVVGGWDRYAQCTVSGGQRFGGTFTSSALDPGSSAGRAWADFNNDGRADFCRITASKYARCTVSTGGGFGSSYVSGPIDAGYDSGRAWADFDGDGRADYCRVIGGWSKAVQCTIATSSGFGATYTSGALDPGWDAGRAWVDHNADGKADYCRVVGQHYAGCTLSTGAGFGQTHWTRSLDPGYDATRTWADLNGDGKADYCRVIGGYQFSCTLSNGTGFWATGTSGIVDPGYDAGRGWADFNGDKTAEPCRVVGGSDKWLQCTVSTGEGFGATYSSSVLDAGYDSGRAWADFDGDGLADYCRVVGGWDKTLECTTSTGTGFGATYRSGATDPGWD